MKRRIFNAIAVVSSVLCVATAALWVRTQFVYDELRMTRWNESLRVFSVPQCFTNAGKMIVATTTCRALPADDGAVARRVAGQWTFRSSRPALHSPHSFWPLKWNYAERQGGFAFVNLHGSGTERRVVIQLWLIAVLLAILPALWALGFVRRRSCRLPGHCKNCGYDLRATPDRCPECGMVPANAPAAVIKQEAVAVPERIS